VSILSPSRVANDGVGVRSTVIEELREVLHGSSSWGGLLRGKSTNQQDHGAVDCVAILEEGAEHLLELESSLSLASMNGVLSCCSYCWRAA
jgi:hypothetical protein